MFKYYVNIILILITYYMYFSSDVTKSPRDDLLLICSTANENITIANFNKLFLRGSPWEPSKKAGN